MPYPACRRQARHAQHRGNRRCFERRDDGSEKPRGLLFEREERLRRVDALQVLECLGRRLEGVVVIGQSLNLFAVECDILFEIFDLAVLLFALFVLLLLGETPGINDRCKRRSNSAALGG